MLRLSAVILLFAGMGFAAPPPAAPPAEYVGVPPQKKLAQLRFFTPRLVRGPTLDVLVEAPPQPAAEPSLPRALLTVQRPGTDLKASVEVVFEEIEGRRPSRSSTRRSEVLLHSGRAKIDISQWPDGEVLVAVAPPDANGARGRVPPAQTVRIIRAQVARSAAAHRDELATWVDTLSYLDPIWGKIPLWPNLDAALAAPDDPYGKLRGFVVRSYENPQLLRRQPYTLYVPQSLDLAQPAPLLILLHGSGGDWRNLVADAAAGQRFETHPMLIANAGAFRYQEYRHLALNDLRGVLEDVARKYNVDRKRIYLQGISLGGRGTLEAAALLPDTFAAVSAHGVYGIQTPWIDPPTILRRDATSAWLAARSDFRTWIGNLRNVPAEIVFGWKDDTTPPVNALMFAALLRRLGGTVSERGFDTDHNISLPAYDWASTRAWFLQHSRSTPRDTIFLRVANLRFNRSGWIAVQALHDYSRIGQVVAKFDAKSNLITIATDNVALLKLDEPPTNASAMAINGAPPVPIERLLRLTPAGQIDTTPPPATQPTVIKRPHQSGPIWDVFSEPVVYVWGTGGDEATTARLRASAQASAQWDLAFGDPSLPCCSDAQVTAKQRESANLVLFTTRGGGGNKLAANLDIPWPAERLASPSTHPTTRPAEPNVRIALRPSPFATNRYVLLVELSVDRPVSLHEVGWWDRAFQADWLVGVARTEPAARGVQILAAGVYDQVWRLGPWTHEDIRTQDLLGAGASK